MAKESLSTKLESSRKELLDLGLRNSLLNYRVSKRRSVDIIEESSAELFRLLVHESKVMSFLPAPKDSDDQQESLPISPKYNGKKNSNPLTDLWLQTEYTEKDLHKRLLSIFHHSRNYIQERGFNILYIALGMLHWYEDDNSDILRKAPLVLIPVEINRTSATEKFKVKYDGAEIDENLSLDAKLKNDFGIKYPSFPELEDLDIYKYIASIEKNIGGMKRWSVSPDEVSLGFFSFGKFLMYRDLGEGSWPDNKKPVDHPLLASILESGFKEPISEFNEEEKLDDYISPDNSNLVVDADCSQLMAILDVNNNRNLVIQGPPGTGKSQTITNIIAEAIGQGKKVLFVAEKMAALEVVKRRLDNLGLGDACLEIHSHNAKKKILLEELKKTFYLGKPKIKEIESTSQLYLSIRDELNGYCEALHTIVGESNFTPYQIFGELYSLQSKFTDIDMPAINDDDDISIDYKYWNRTQLEQWKIQIINLQSIVSDMGIPVEHPFFGSDLQVFLPQDKDVLKANLTSAITTVKNLNKHTTELANYLGLKMKLVRSESEILIAAAERALNSPHLEGVKISTGEWQTKRDDLSTLLASGTRHSEIHTKYDKRLEVDAWELDLFATRQSLKNFGDKWWRIFSKEYRDAKKLVKGILKTRDKLSLEEQLELVEEIMEAARLEEYIIENDDLGVRLFGIQWEKEKSNWDVLKKITDWVIELYRDVGDGIIPEGIVSFMSGGPKIEPLKDSIIVLESALKEHLYMLERLFLFIKFDKDLSADFIFKSDYNLQEDKLTQMLESVNLISDQIRFNNIKEPLVKEGISWLIDIALTWEHANTHLLNIFLYKFFNKLIKVAYNERIELQKFNGITQEKSIAKFRELDEYILIYNRLKLAEAHWNNLPHHNSHGQLGILMREFEKKSRHLPIRQLMIKAGSAIQAIKPVFMMSPMSIASFLATDRESFDLIIFDEASQVKPVDAFGAILRGKQLVVVGDDKQLPPTSFFDTLIELDDAELDENITSDMESILGLMVAQGSPQRMLMWHYRSRHESLIMTSNHEFYNDKLKVFPSPNTNGDNSDYGLSYRHLPNAFYDRGRSRTNSHEAEIVAQAVIDHAKKFPQLTLGVATFSIAQMQAVMDKLELLRRENQEVESFFSSHPEEPFFVKNLESVQGDERDVIFISVGYGKTKDGYVSMNFGALNNNGGERRLNVLISRARKRCIVYSNLSYNDIDLGRTQSRGVLALKRFLKYAETGDLDIPQLTEGGSDSIFEEEVANALKSYGYLINQQVGSAGFFIDIAVADNNQPGRFLLGVECDGASYHSSKTARDRDRIRQQVLEGLGWQIYRIWSTDWFNNPDAELRKLIEEIEKAKSKIPSKQNRNSIKKGILKKQPKLERSWESNKYIKPTKKHTYQNANFDIGYFGYEFHEIPHYILEDSLIKIVNIEGPIHKDLLFKRITELANVTRVGSRISSLLNWILNTMCEINTVFCDNDFIWNKNNDLSKVRNREWVEARFKKIKYIYSKEIEAAIKQSIAGTFGIRIEEIPPLVAKLFGFSKTSEEIRITVDSIIRDMIEKGELTDKDVIIP